MATFLQNNWYWWETNDKYIATWKWQVLESRSININKSSKYFYNANWNLPYPQSNYPWTWTTNIRQILFWNSFANRLFFFFDWTIYNIFWLNKTIGKNLVNAWVIWNKGFILYTNWSIDTWIYNSSSNDLWLSTLTSNVITWLTINNDFAPFNIANWKIYLATWYKVYTIDILTFTLESTLEILTWWQIRWITKIWNKFNIYANYWDNSQQFIWDWISWAPDYVINWYDKAIQNVANINNIDYVVCENWLYIANGYQPKTIIQRTFLSNFTNAIETYRNKIFIPWYWWVYTYQFDKPWFPWNFSTELILPTIDWNQNVSCMKLNSKIFDTNIWKYTQDIFIAYLNYNTNNTYTNFLVQYTNDRFLSDRNSIWWSVTLNPIIWLKGTPKQSKKVRLWYNLNSNTWLAAINYTYAWTTKIFYFKHSIWIFAYRDQTTKMSCYIWDFTIKPTLWSIYSINWNSATITNIDNLFEVNLTWHGWIEFELDQATNLEHINKSIQNITKMSWIWDNSWTLIVAHLWEIVTLITNNNLNGKSLMYPWNFDEVIFTIHITEWDLQINQDYKNTRLQTRVYDFAFLYNEIQNDLS